jgi:hypothetical protein
MSVWPGTLPPPLLSSYHNNDQLPTIRTDMESGPPRKARSTRHFMTRGQLSMVLDASQMAAFQQMIVDSNYTADWITDCPIDTGGGLTNHRIRISSVQRKVSAPPDRLWTVTVSFETDEHL